MFFVRVRQFHEECTISFIEKQTKIWTVAAVKINQPMHHARRRQLLKKPAFH